MLGLRLAVILISVMALPHCKAKQNQSRMASFTASQDGEARYIRLEPGARASAFADLWIYRCAGYNSSADCQQKEQPAVIARDEFEAKLNAIAMDTNIGVENPTLIKSLAGEVTAKVWNIAGRAENVQLRDLHEFQAAFAPFPSAVRRLLGFELPSRGEVVEDSMGIPLAGYKCSDTLFHNNEGGIHVASLNCVKKFSQERLSYCFANWVLGRASIDLRIVESQTGLVTSTTLLDQAEPSPGETWKQWFQENISKCHRHEMEPRPLKVAKRHSLRVDVPGMDCRIGGEHKWFVDRAETFRFEAQCKEQGRECNLTYRGGQAADFEVITGLDRTDKLPVSHRSQTAIDPRSVIDSIKTQLQKGCPQ